MRLKNCYRTRDFRQLARQRLPAPIFHYIDGGSDDEVTLARNTSAFDDVDLVPNVLAGIDDVDLTANVLGRQLKLPLMMSPTAMQRAFHHDGELAIARAAEKYGAMFGVSTLGTRSIEELGEFSDVAKFFQIYVHHDAALTTDLVERCRAAEFDALVLTVDTIVAGNRERDYLTGMATPPRLTPRSFASFATHLRWASNYLLREPFDLPNIRGYVSAGRKTQTSIVDYINTQMKSAISWDDAAHMIEEWGGPFAVKGVMSVDDARRCVDIGASAIMVSNHGGRQLDGGIRRGTHVLKALAAGATACSGGRMYLYALAGAGFAGVDRALGLLGDEIERGLKLMGCKSLPELSPAMLADRPKGSGRGGAA